MGRKKFWVLNKAEGGNEAELLLYGPIGDETFLGDEITPRKFKEDLEALGDIDTLNIYINSEGGDVFAGQAVYSILSRHKAQKIVYIDGLAASIASVIAMAGDLVVMPKNAMMMIHNPWTIAMGNANDFRKLADDLDKIRESLIAAYQSKSNLSKEEIIELMDAETWMTAEEALQYGFADEIEKEKQVAASIDEKFLKVYRNIPKKLIKVKDGVVPEDISKETAPEDTTWEAPNLSDFTDKSWDELSDSEKKDIARHFAWTPEMPPERFSDLKLPHHDPKTHKVVWRGVTNAAARLEQTDIPEEDKEKVRQHLARHYKQFGKTPPWEQDNNKAKLLKAKLGLLLETINI
ncbi:head maturation protease, ClpP-related [Caldanaerobius polysaccharolyticus]|uniref:head maturation protease, ClpP-related n=1 Tax=Caldanaerobius polysaccharolyticus TaxID=44256 RepID=UPI000A03EDD7|nr:head maturation protease, ClpP-related [Caldanaerobius polysaccharolyticus]